MKKILIASTALVSTAGLAAAEVALTGRAEMGIYQYNAAYGAAKGLANNGDPQFFTDIDVTFTMSGETDNGLTFGASVDLDEADGSATTGVSGATGNNSDDGGATIFISGGFGTVTMGDTDGALDWALTDAGNVGNPGSIADDETEHAGYVGAYLDGANDGQILRWDYTSGAFGVAVSLEDDNGSTAANTGIGYAVGFKYSMNVSGTTVNFGLGHQKAADGAPGTPDDIKATGVSVDATFANGLSAGIQYADWSSVGATGPDSNMAIGLGYTTGAISMHVNYGEVELNNGTKSDGFGIAAAYDLGGGAVVHFGYGQGDAAGATVTQKSASLGLGLSF